MQRLRNEGGEEVSAGRRVDLRVACDSWRTLREEWSLPKNGDRVMRLSWETWSRACVLESGRCRRLSGVCRPVFAFFESGAARPREREVAVWGGQPWSGLSRMASLLPAGAEETREGVYAVPDMEGPEVVKALLDLGYWWSLSAQAEVCCRRGREWTEGLQISFDAWIMRRRLEAELLPRSVLFRARL